MINSIQDYARQLAIVGTARLNGRDARAVVIDDPWIANDNELGPTQFLGFPIGNEFEPSFYKWIDFLKADGVVGLIHLETFFAEDWSLKRTPPTQGWPELGLVRRAGVTWCRRHMDKENEERFQFTDFKRPFEILSISAATREFKMVTAEMVEFLHVNANAKDPQEGLYFQMAGYALEAIAQTEWLFTDFLARDREIAIARRRTELKSWGFSPEEAQLNCQRDDFVSVMMDCALPWEACRLALAARSVQLPRFKAKEADSLDPEFIFHPDYRGLGEKWSRATADALNAAVNVGLEAYTLSADQLKK